MQWLYYDGSIVLRHKMELCCNKAQQVYQQMSQLPESSVFATPLILSGPARFYVKVSLHASHAWQIELTHTFLQI